MTFLTPAGETPEALHLRIIGIHTIQLFPPAWDWRRVAELWISVYWVMIGCVFWWHPASLDHSSYAMIRSVMPAQGWALTIWAVAIAHLTAIWINGRSPGKTPILRLVACALHLTVLAVLLICFVSVSDFYRATTTIAFSAIVLGAASIAAEDLVKARNGRAP